MKRKISIISVILIFIIVFVLIITILNLNKNMKKEETLKNNNSTNTAEVQTLSDGTSINKRTNFENTKRFGDYEISNMVFTSNNNVTTIIANIKNISNVKLEEKIVTLKLLDKQNNEITSLSGIIKTLDAKESTTLKIKSTLNYIDAYNYEIK